MNKKAPTESSPLERLYFGKDDAESDIAAGGLLEQGYLPTAAHEAAVKGRKRLIIGRKGSGKSAICIMIREMLRKGGNASLVTPDEISADEIRRFQLEGILPEQSKALLWRYIFALQAAKFILCSARKEFSRETDFPEEIKAVRKFLFDNNEVDDLSLHEKFWRIMEKLKASISLEAFGVKFGGELEARAEGIRAAAQIDSVEQMLATAFRLLFLNERDPKFILLVDQVEKVWSNDRNSDLMVVGLLLASKHLASVLPMTTCVVFLRTDIYDLLQFADRDKFRGDEMHIDWSDQSLSSLALARARASVGPSLDKAQLWGEIFPSEVDGTPTESYLIKHTLMRPRDVIQLCNACADSARKNGHLQIEDMDIQEALKLYSNWKFSDLINEWRVNYPFLNDLFVLFASTSYIVTRPILERRFRSMEGGLTDRHPEFKAVFNIDSILDILYSIGFLGVVRGGRTIFAYEDPDSIELHENRFVLHPCFRQALRSTSSVDLNPYESRRDRIYSHRFYSEFSQRRGASPRARMGRPFRLAQYIADELSELQKATARTGLPEEVRQEIRRNLELIENDLSSVQKGDLIEGLDISRRTLEYVRGLTEKLDTLGLLDGKDGKQLGRALGSIAATLERGLLYDELIES